VAPEEMGIERLDHLGIVAGMCREIGLVDYLDARDEHTHERVSVGTDSDAGNDPQRAGVCQSAHVFGPAIFRYQAGGTLAGSRNQCR
jgi:hypothetical protein